MHIRISRIESRKFLKIGIAIRGRNFADCFLSNMTKNFPLPQKRVENILVFSQYTHTVSFFTLSRFFQPRQSSTMDDLIAMHVGHFSPFPPYTFNATSITTGSDVHRKLWGASHHRVFLWPTESPRTVRMGTGSPNGGC